MASKNSSKGAFWREHVLKYKASGLRRSEYCRKHGLGLHQLAYQVGLYNKGSAAEPSSFAKVLVAEPPAAPRQTGARLLLGGGMAIEFDAGSDPDWVARFIAAVGGLK